MAQAAGRVHRGANGINSERLSGNGRTAIASCVNKENLWCPGAIVKIDGESPLAGLVHRIVQREFVAGTKRHRDDRTRLGGTPQLRRSIASDTVLGAQPGVIRGVMGQDAGQTID